MIKKVIKGIFINFKGSIKCLPWTKVQPLTKLWFLTENFNWFKELIIYADDVLIISNAVRGLKGPVVRILYGEILTHALKRLFLHKTFLQLKKISFFFRG